MATITATESFDAVAGAYKLVWTGITTTTDTAASYRIKGNGAKAGFVQFAGTFAGGSSATLNESGDDTNFTAMKDVHSANVVATAAASFSFGTNALYIKPIVTTGSGDNVDVTVWLYGK